MTKKIPAAMFLLLIASLSAPAQPPAGWVKFSPPGSQFSVLLPAEPKGDTQTSPSPHGPYTTHLFTSVAPNREIYLVGWVDYDPKFNFGIQAELNANRDKFVEGVKGRLVGATTPIKLGAHPGIEFRAALDNPAADIVSRVFIVGRRPYQLIVLTPKGVDASANIERFLSSFAVPAAK